MKKLKVGSTVTWTMQVTVPPFKFFAFGEVLKLHGNGTADVEHAGNGSVATMPVSELTVQRS